MFTNSTKSTIAKGALSKGAAKPKAKRTVKTKPSSGQSGPRIKLTVDQLNQKERKVYDALGRRASMTLAELASVCWPRLSRAQANSWVRNQLRRLVCARLVVKTAEATYSRKG